ncbi:MAG: hypothetical protein JXL85_04595, partial [Bacilli bacterium]|nr:hypothetical protein [Bacilli bacterium]
FLLFCTLICTQAKNFDFELTKFECFDSIVKPGDLILIQANVALFGDTIPSSPCSFQLYLSTDTIVDDQDIKFCDGQSVLTGERACHWFRFYGGEKQQPFVDFFSVPVPYDLSGNDYYLIGFVDFQEKYAETNENNNIKYIPLTVSGTANNDFFIQSVSVHDVRLKPNQKFSFSFENCYAGDNEFEMKPILNFMYSRDTIWGNAEDDIQIYTDPWTGPTLSHSDSVELVNWNLDIKNGLQGDYYLLIKTDWDDRFKEVDETNNFTKIKIFIEEEVNDYWIESLSSDFTTLQPDQEIRLTCESRYQGNNAAVLEAPIHYYFSKDSILDATDYSLMGHGGFGHA